MILQESELVFFSECCITHMPCRAMFIDLSYYREYLTGFHKRKVEKRKKAIEFYAAKAVEERKELRRENVSELTLPLLNALDSFIILFLSIVRTRKNQSLSKSWKGSRS
jgi:hypothetical protein